MVNKKSVTFEEVLEEVKKYIHKPENIDLITRAYLFARDQHEGQFRKRRAVHHPCHSGGIYVGAVAHRPQDGRGRVPA